jgi:tetratricopeptide (TPR) repeat protein
MLCDQAAFAVRTGRWDEGLAIAESIVDGPLTAQLAVGMAPVIEAMLYRGHLDEAEAQLELIPDGAVSPDVQTRTVYLAVLSSLLSLRGDAEKALATARAGYAGRQELGVLSSQVKEALVQAIESAFALEDLPAVEELLREIDALRPGELTPSLRSHAARFRARLHAARGEHDMAGAAFSEAASSFRETALPLWLAITLLEQAEWQAASGDAEAARAALDEAVPIISRLGAQPLADRASSLAERIGTT